MEVFRNDIHVWPRTHSWITHLWHWTAINWWNQNTYANSISYTSMWCVLSIIWVKLFPTEQLLIRSVFHTSKEGFLRLFYLLDLGKCGITLKWLDLPSAHAEGNIGASGLERCGNNVCCLSAILQSAHHLYLPLGKQATRCIIPITGDSVAAGDGAAAQKAWESVFASCAEEKIQECA